MLGLVIAYMSVAIIFFLYKAGYCKRITTFFTDMVSSLKGKSESSQQGSPDDVAISITTTDGQEEGVITSHTQEEAVVTTHKEEAVVTTHKQEDPVVTTHRQEEAVVSAAPPALNITTSEDSVIFQPSPVTSSILTSTDSALGIGPKDAIISQTRQENNVESILAAPESSAEIVKPGSKRAITASSLLKAPKKKKQEE